MLALYEIKNKRLTTFLVRFFVIIRMTVFVASNLSSRIRFRFIFLGAVKVIAY